MANGDRLFVPASGSTGVEAWEISPCLKHYDPHGTDSYTEAYHTLEDAEKDSYEGTGCIFWGVYAVMREAVHSSGITPTMHLMDFDSPDDAMEFVSVLNRREE